MTGLTLAVFILWLTLAWLLVYSALRVAARADSIDDAFYDGEDGSDDNALLSVGPSAGSGTDEEGGEG